LVKKVRNQVPYSGSRYLKAFVPALCFVVFVALMNFGCKKKTVETPPPPPTPTPVVAQGSIVYVQMGHLVRLDLDGNQITPLTSGKSTEWFPACSPKGDQVVYWSNAEGGIYNLWKINLDGSQRVQLTFDETNSLRTGDQNLLVNTAPSWSADGSRVIYAISGDIWSMDADGYNPETLLIGHSALCPLLSPDGKTLVYLSNQDDSVFNLWTLNLSDKTLKQLTHYTDWNVGSPSFSHDGRKILFNLYRANISQVYTINADGTDPLNITNNNKSLCPRYAMMDRKILYCSWGNSEDDGLNIYLVNANGTEAKAITTDEGSSPSWAPARILAMPMGK
jgi:Tol biopolymer transport system component